MAGSERACSLTTQPLLELADRNEHATATADKPELWTNVLVEEVP
jgi:hypothetical protein